MRLRISKLSPDGELVGEPVEFESPGISWEPLPLIEEPCARTLRVSRPVSISLRLSASKELERLLLSPTWARKRKRAERHRARIVVVPKRRYKHGRVGVFR